MKKDQKIALGTVLVISAVVGFAFFLGIKKKNARIVEEIADQGYETAIDILFDGYEQPGKKLHYGPVIPA